MKTRQELTLADCETIMAAALAEARRNQWIVAVAILDDGGHLLHFARMDGASPGSAAISVEKARTAAVTRRNSGVWEERIKQGRTALLKMPGVLPVQGGVPILVEGGCVGAVGVSGVQSHEDEKIAQAGIDALLKR
jgi:glc operon protein GlcG